MLGFFLGFAGGSLMFGNNWLAGIGLVMAGIAAQMDKYALEKKVRNTPN